MDRNRASFRDEYDIEHGDYIDGYDSDDVSSEQSQEENGRNWDESELEIVPLTPSKNGSIRERTPLSKRKSSRMAVKANKAGSTTGISKMAKTVGSNFLSAYFPPSEKTPKKVVFKESFSVDGRTKTPSFPLERDAIHTSSGNKHRNSLNYFPTKYLTSVKPKVAAPPPRLSGSSQDSVAPGALQVLSPTDRSNASFNTNFSQISFDSRHQSVMSHRSSTSMSLLYGEVINFAGSRILDSTASELSEQRPSVTGSRPMKGDLEQHFHGMEIGGSRPDSVFHSIALSGSLEPPMPQRPSFGINTEAIVSGLQQVLKFGHTTHREMKKLGAATSALSKRVLHYYRPPLSPRARDLANLSFLQQAHKERLGKLTDNADLGEDHYDFVLVLTPQEVYRFWADLLDFRVEHLGFEAMLEPIIESAATFSTEDTQNSDAIEEEEVENNFSTPLTGIRRRGKATSSRNAPDSLTRASLVNSLFSPGNSNIPTTAKMNRSRLSMFEKAVGGFSPTPTRMKDESANTGRTTNMDDSRQSIASVRRRWGNRAMHTNGSNKANILSPPVRSLTRGVSSVQKARTPGKNIDSDTKPEDEKENDNPNRILSEDEIPNEVIPRGIAARTNGMLKFLSALKRGIVVRRHRPNKEAVYCKIFSNDGGDTIQYQPVDPEEAMVAFKEQRVRYNRKVTHSSSPSSVKAISREWSCLDGPEEGSGIHKFNVPDHVASQRYREKIFREHGIKKQISDLANQAANSGFIRASDIVAVHPASHHDPRHPGVRKGELGTASLRRSKSDHYTPHTFSLVSMVGQRFKKKGKTKKIPGGNENKWYSGEGNDLHFKCTDFEAATEGEYWLIFRGFLLLHRDASVGRFATQRQAGIGGGSRGRERDFGGGEGDEWENRLHRDEFNEPVTVGCLEKLIVKFRNLDKTYMKGFVAHNAVAPPSDYFLGFKSAGTQIWSRLRLAGLETQRIFAIDTRRVMIKVRCPEDRLTDVAEVLRLKMKTIDGSFAPFREDSAHLFKARDDILDTPSIYQGKIASLIQSKDRQSIIDFIIGSRIRDSGAELGQTTDVGKMIQARVPLHMPRKLDSLLNSWVTYWRKENWIDRDSTSLYTETDASEREGFDCEGGKETKEERKVPGCLARFFIGAFHQPLDSIEEYFGEQVTFYFAWLQHCAVHLWVLTIFGLIVTICQITTDDFDHPIRPFYSVGVMLWTFLVLVNWKKRSNFLAYRWGSMDYKVQETPRPEFHGEYVVDDITQEWVVKYPKWKRWLKYIISVPISVAFTVTALLLILLVHANRDLQMASYVEQRTNPDADPFKFELSLKNIGRRAKIVDIEITKELLFDPTFWAVMGALPAMLGLCFPLMNLILMRISVMLNNFENYRTESEYRTHLIIKVFSFRFVSQFGTVYYYAFIAMGSKQAIENGILRMGTSIMIYTTVAHWWQIFLQVYFFMYIRNFRRFLYQRKLLRELRNIELDEERITNELSDAEACQIRLINKRMLLDQAQDDVWFEIMNPPHDSFPEYITAVVQFSFVACFSCVLPITPLFCLINYLLSMRYDAYKLCRGRRRPLAKKTGGIGIWEHLLHIVAVVAVLTNCWLIAFTNSDFTLLAEKIGTLGIFGIIVAWEHIMLLIKYVMQTAISTLPRCVRDELKREQHRLDQQRYSTMRSKDRRSQFQRAKSNVSLPTSESATVQEIPQTKSLLLTPENRMLRMIPSADENSCLSPDDNGSLYSC